MSSPRNIRQKIKLKFRKEIVGDGKKVTVNHLIRSLPFDTKSRLCTIRKQPLFETLSGTQYKVRKTYSLSKLLDIAKEALHYDKKLAEVNKRLSTFQRLYKKYYSNLELRLQGPGIPVSRCVNEDCPYTMETLTDIPKTNIFTWKDDKIYGCDFQPLYQLISKHIDRTGTLYECKENEYKSIINDYITLSQSSNTRRLNRSRLGPIKNPFTRSPFPGEAFYRVLDIGKRRGLFSKEPQNQRIRQRSTRERQRNQERDLSEEEEQPTVIPPSATEISSEVSEYIRNLDFYTPETILTDIIRPIVSYSRGTGVPIPLDHAHSSRIFTYITRSCIPILEHLADHFTSSLIRNNIRRSNVHYDFYRSFRQGFHIRSLHSQSSAIREMISDTDSPPRTLSVRVRRFCRIFLSVWVSVFQTLNSLFIAESINVDDKKSIAIFIIISLAQTGFLREGFEWAIGL